tara:strand:- start:588 stop:812 length:225 start_codon:yes stop_codon:yes gene_type:complete
MKGKDVNFSTGKFEHVIDRVSEKWTSWEEWCEKVVWWGNKKGAYLYECMIDGNKSEVKKKEAEGEPFGNDARYQ